MVVIDCFDSASTSIKKFRKICPDVSYEYTATSVDHNGRSIGRRQNITHRRRGSGAADSRLFRCLHGTMLRGFDVHALAAAAAAECAGCALGEEQRLKLRDSTEISRREPNTVFDLRARGEKEKKTVFA